MPAFGQERIELDGLRGQDAALQEMLGEGVTLQEMAGVFAVARELHAEIAMLSDPDREGGALTPDVIYATARENVITRRRQALVDEAEHDVARTEGERITAELTAKELPGIRKAAREKFTQKEEPKVRAKEEARLREELLQAALRDLRKQRPAEIREELEQTLGPDIIAQATAIYAAQHEEKDRKTAEAAVQKELQAATGRQLKEAVTAEVRETRVAEEKERLRQAAEREARLERIIEDAQRTHRIEFKDLERDDLLTITLCPEDQSMKLGTADGKHMRAIRLSLRSKAMGRFMVVDDSWMVGEAPLEQSNALRSGQIITVALATDHEPEEPTDGGAKDEHISDHFAFMRGVPLRITRAGQPIDTVGYEIHKVHWGGEKDKQKLLLGAKNNTNW